jgi:Domain of unknown function (DUF4214)
MIYLVYMKKYFKVIPAIIVITLLFAGQAKALTYQEILQNSRAKVLGNLTLAYSSGSLVNDNGTIYFICGNNKIPFTNWNAFIGLGYLPGNVVNGSLSAYALSTSYFLSSPNVQHPWCSWLYYNGTVYYSHESGLIAVPSWEVFLNNGGQSKFIVKANSFDVQVLQNNPNLPLLVSNDSRVYKQQSLTQPLPTPTPVSATIDTLDYFLSDHTDKTLTGTHPLSLTVSGNTAYYVKWAADSFERYTWDDQYIYLKEDHSGSPDPRDNTTNPGTWMKRKMAVGEQIDVSENYLQYNDPVTCKFLSTGGLGYKMILEQHIPDYDLGGDLGKQDVIVMKYDYSSSSLQEYEKSYYSKEWGFVKWEHYKNGVVFNSSSFNKISTQAPIAPNLSVSCQGAKPIFTAPAIPATVDGLINTLYACVLNNSSPDTAGFNFWKDSLQKNGADINSLYTQFFGFQKDVVPAIGNEEFAKKLYGCVLFRDADPSSLSNVLIGLANGSLNRTGLVQTVLNSDEFKTNILPKLKLLLPVPAVPMVPTSLNGFVSHLYSCVLMNNNPDSGGVSYWLNLLQTKAITSKDAYISFFGYQKDLANAVSNEQFAKQLYECTLFREVDAVSYNNVLTGLNNSTLTRTSLVQSVLNSDEFNTGILPKLQVLK